MADTRDHYNAGLVILGDLKLLKEVDYAFHMALGNAKRIVNHSIYP